MANILKSLIFNLIPKYFRYKMIYNTTGYEINAIEKEFSDEWRISGTADFSNSESIRRCCQQTIKLNLRVKAPLFNLSFILLF